MIELVRLCVEYLELESRRPAASLRRLEGLRRLFAEPPPGGDGTRRAHDRAEAELRVALIVPGGPRAGRLLDIGGGGLRVALRGRVPDTATAVAVVTDGERACAYRFPCEVMWRRGDVLGLRFAGLPLRDRRPAAE